MNDDEIVKRRMPVQDLLHWAFAIEYAQLDLPDLREHEDRGIGFGMEHMLLERARLGTQVDSSKGTSSAHQDAELVAATVRHLPESVGGLRMAVRVVELARAGLIPDWMPNAVPRLYPSSVQQSNGDWVMGKPEVVSIIYEDVFVPHPKNPKKHIKRQKQTKVMATPCRWIPSRYQISRSRELYIEWWIALVEIQHRLKGHKGLRKYEVTDHLPQMKPWENSNAF